MCCFPQTVKMHLHQATWLVAHDDPYNQEYTEEHRLQRKDMAEVVESINDILEEIMYLVHE